MNLNFKPIYAIFLREIKVFTREKERVASMLVSPLLFLFALGRAVDAQSPTARFTYQQFIYPGTLAMVILFTSITYGLYIVWDKRLDFLKEVLAAPISRADLFIGKAAGGVFSALVETVIVLLIGRVFILKINFVSALLCLLATIVVSMMITSIGLSIGGKMKTMEGFGLVMSFLTWPMFFLSGALFEIKDDNFWLKIAALINPFTYCVDLIRKILIGYSSFPVATDLAVIFAFTTFFCFIGIKIFGDLQQSK